MVKSNVVENLEIYNFMVQEMPLISILNTDPLLCLTSLQDRGERGLMFLAAEPGKVTAEAKN